MFQKIVENSENTNNSETRGISVILAKPLWCLIVVRHQRSNRKQKIKAKPEIYHKTFVNLRDTVYSALPHPSSPPLPRPPLPSPPIAFPLPLGLIPLAPESPIQVDAPIPPFLMHALRPHLICLPAGPHYRLCIKHLRPRHRHISTMRIVQQVLLRGVRVRPRWLCERYSTRNFFYFWLGCTIRNPPEKPSATLGRYACVRPSRYDCAASKYVSGKAPSSRKARD